MNMSFRRLSISSLTFWAALFLWACYMLWPIRDRLKFGIDLVGGTYITLEVQTEKAVTSELQGQLSTISKQLKAEKNLPTSQKVEGKQIILRFNDSNSAFNAQQLIESEGAGLEASLDDSTLTLNLPLQAEDTIKRNAVDGTVDILRTRLTSTGVEEITIFRRGERNIVVELPDVQDPVKAKKLIGTPAMLEFRMVEYLGDRPVVASTKEGILDILDDEIPEGSMIVSGKSRGSEKTYYLVQDYSDVTGRHLKDARPSISNGALGVGFTFTHEGGERFHEMTSQNIGKQMAVLIDGKVIQVAAIHDAIRDSGTITGTFNDREVKELSAMLKSGAFVAPVTFEEERRVGPSLGRDSINSGLLACLVGLAMLFCFSLWYYKLSGLFAFFALIYNLVLILFGMYWLGAALTLPGIAGMVLTTGMAIDSSILIYERIKELLAAGSSTRKAVREGFSDAMVTILDANITTFIVGIVLYKFGTGPIQGFAATMMIGIVATLITGLWFLRSIFEVIVSREGSDKLSI